MRRRSPRVTSILLILGLVSLLISGFIESSNSFAGMYLPLQIDHDSLNLPPAKSGMPYRFILKGKGGTGKYTCVPESLRLGSIKLSQNCEISGTAPFVTKSHLSEIVNFEMKDGSTPPHIATSGAIKFTVLGAATNSPSPLPTNEPSPFISPTRGPNPGNSGGGTPSPTQEPNPQNSEGTTQDWHLESLKTTSPVALTIKVGPFKVGPTSCTMSGIVSVTMALNVVGISNSNDIKAVFPATSSDFKIVKISNDCGQPTYASQVFKTATDQLVGDVEFVSTGSLYEMKLNHDGTRINAGLFVFQGISLSGSFNIPAITDGMGDNISILSDPFVFLVI